MMYQHKTLKVGFGFWVIPLLLALAVLSAENAEAHETNTLFQFPSGVGGYEAEVAHNWIFEEDLENTPTPMRACLTDGGDDQVCGDRTYFSFEPFTGTSKGKGMIGLSFAGLDWRDENHNMGGSITVSCSAVRTKDENGASVRNGSRYTILNESSSSNTGRYHAFSAGSGEPVTEEGTYRIECSASSAGGYSYNYQEDVDVSIPDSTAPSGPYTVEVRSRNGATKQPLPSSWRMTWGSVTNEGVNTTSKTLSISDESARAAFTLSSVTIPSGYDYYTASLMHDCDSSSQYHSENSGSLPFDLSSSIQGGCILGVNLDFYEYSTSVTVVSNEPGIDYTICKSNSTCKSASTLSSPSVHVFTTPGSTHTLTVVNRRPGYRYEVFNSINGMLNRGAGSSSVWIGNNEHEVFYVNAFPLEPQVNLTSGTSLQTFPDCTKGGATADTTYVSSTSTQNVQLVWSACNVSSCRGSWDNYSTVLGVQGSKVVQSNPSQRAAYTVRCTQNAGY